MTGVSTPLQRTPIRAENDGAKESLLRSPLIASSFKSPQVLFDSSNGKHQRATPSSGRGLSKKLKSKLLQKTPKPTHTFASPSVIHARSMLSFDLHGGVPIAEDHIPGDSDLFVKFVKNRRKSDGRGSLRELINKRIALQTSGQVLALRKINDPKPVVVEKQETDPPKSKPPKKTVRFKQPATAPVRTSDSSRKDLEIPLGQGDDFSRTADPTQPYISQDLTPTQRLSPTQQLTPTQELSPTQPVSSSRESTPVIASPLQSSVSPSVSGTQVSEQPQWLGTQEPSPPRRRVKNMFVDDEASEDDEEGVHGSDDDSDASEESDLSDLVASTPEESDEDSAGHAKLHMQWRNEMEENFDPFAPKGRRGNDDDNNPHQSRKDRLIAAAAQLVEPIPAKKSPKKITQKKIIPPPPDKVPEWKSVTRKRAGPKRNPHRRSSVSSVDRLEISTNASVTRPVASGNFSFITAPSKSALDKIDNKHHLKTIAEESAAAPQRLMGNKRFVFGKSAAS